MSNCLVSKKNNRIRSLNSCEKGAGAFVSEMNNTLCYSPPLPQDCCTKTNSQGTIQTYIVQAKSQRRPDAHIPKTKSIHQSQLPSSPPRTKKKIGDVSCLLSMLPSTRRHRLDIANLNLYSWLTRGIEGKGKLGRIRSMMTFLSSRMQSQQTTMWRHICRVLLRFLPSGLCGSHQWEPWEGQNASPQIDLENSNCGRLQLRNLNSGHLVKRAQSMPPLHQGRMIAVGCVQIRTLTNCYHVCGATHGHTIGVPTQWDPEGPVHRTSRY